MATSFVDLEGDAIWVSEYIRYRLSGCAHFEAIPRVLTQIDGNPPGGECGSDPSGLIPFPSRADVLAFRQLLEVKYQQLGRGLSSSFVDLEGSSIWIEQFMYYRANACSAADSQAKVFNEIDGKGAQAVCYVAPAPCAFFFRPNVVQPSGAGGSFTVDVLKSSGPDTCTWTAASENSWLTITNGTSGADRGIVSYTVASNLSNVARSGKIRASWTGGSAVLDVFQTEQPFKVLINMYDYKESTGATTECRIKNVGGTPTTCTLTATASLPEAGTNYQWVATYNYYSATKTAALNGANATMTFQESCSGAASSGDVFQLNVTLTVTDSKGNTQTVVSGSGANPPLSIRVFPCS